MKNVRSWVLPALGAAVAFGFVHAQTACSSSSAPAVSSDGGTDGGGTGDIIIGFSNALSGGISGLGVPLVQVANVAEQQVNQVGVLGGRHIHIDVFDDLSDPTVGAFNAANHFIGENVPAVFGPLASGQCLGVPDGGTGGAGDLNNLYASHMIIEISPSATSPLLTTDQPMTNRFFFRTAPADDFQGKAVALLMHDGVMPIGDAGAPSTGDSGDAGGPARIGGGCNNAYLVNGDDEYGNGLMNVVAASFMSKGGTVLGHDKVSTTLAPSYSTETQTVVAAAPDCLVLVTYSDVGAQFMRDLRVAMNAPAGTPLTFPVYGSDGEYDANFIPYGEATGRRPTRGERDRRGHRNDARSGAADDRVRGVPRDLAAELSGYGAASVRRELVRRDPRARVGHRAGGGRHARDRNPRRALQGHRVRGRRHDDHPRQVRAGRERREQRHSDRVRRRVGPDVVRPVGQRDGELRRLERPVAGGLLDDGRLLQHRGTHRFVDAPVMIAPTRIATIIGADMRTGIFFSFASLAGALVACSAGTSDHASAPSSYTYEIEFPSTQAAVGADTVQVFVFSQSTPETDCPSLITDVSSQESLPPTVAQTNQLALCDVLSGSKGEIPNVTYGDVAFLVVAQRNGANYFSGCALATISASSGPVDVSLTAVSDTTTILPTTCMSVSAFCSQSCTVGDAGS